MDSKTVESFSVRTIGSSMEPTFFEGDLLQLTQIDTNLKKGAIYSFQKDDFAASHRLVGETNDYFIFQGDRQPHSETVTKNSRFCSVDRILDRYTIPIASSIVLGLVKNIDPIKTYSHPANTTSLWPWNEIRVFAHQQRLLSALAYALKTSDLWNQTPVSEQEFYKTVLYEDSFRWEKISQVKADVSKALPEAIFLKGSSTAQWLYPNPMLRTMFDIDILVSVKNFNASIDALKNSGFHLSSDSVHEFESTHEAAFIHIDSGLRVELHRSLFLGNRFEISPQELLQPNSTDRLEYELLYFSAHAVTHFGRHGIYYLEIYRYFCHHDFNKNNLIIKARESRTLIAYCLALRIIKSWWNTDIDCEAEKNLNRRQRLFLFIADLFYTHNFQIKMGSRSSKILQALIFDSLASLFKFTFNHDRRRLSNG